MHWNSLRVSLIIIGDLKNKSFSTICFPLTFANLIWVPIVTMLGLWWGLIEAKQWLVSTPHRTVRIAPALIGQNRRTTTISARSLSTISVLSSTIQFSPKPKKKHFWVHVWGGAYYLVLCIFLQLLFTYLITSEWLAAQHWIVKLNIITQHTRGIVYTGVGI